MRIVVATPLYPPEVADAASYAYELARRLSREHEVTVLAYAHMPEPLPGVRVVCVAKRASRVSRLLSFAARYREEASVADAVIAVNGASVELPLVLGRPPAVFCIADRAAHERASVLESLIARRARTVMREVPPVRPELLPLAPRPREELERWEEAWEAHYAALGAALQRHE